MNFIDKMVERFMKVNKRMRHWKRVVSVLSAVVVFATTYALILPAITLDVQTASTQEGMEIAASENESESGGTVYEAEPEEKPDEEDEASLDTEADTEDSEEQSVDENANENSGSENGSNESEPLEETKNEETDASDESGIDDDIQISEEAATSATTALTDLIIEDTQLIYEADEYIVYADFGESAKFPAGVELRVKEITEESDPDIYAMYYEKALGEMQDKYDESSTLSFARFYDIAFVYEDTEIEPNGNVSVRIEYKKAVAVQENTTVDTIHFDKNDDEKAEVIDSDTEGSEKKVEAVEFESDQFSVYGIVGTEVIQTPAGELSFEGDGYIVKISYTEKSEIPLGTELTVRELEEGTDEYSEYLTRTEAALRGDESEVNLENENASDKISRLLSAFDESRQTNIFDIILVYEEEEIEPNPDYPISIEITYDTDISQKEKENELDAKIVHFADAGTEVISDVEFQKNKDGTITLAYEQNSFSRTAASLLSSYGNGGWYGGNGNQLVFRYGYKTVNGEPVFEIQYNGGAINTPTLVATPGSWPGDPGYPHNPQTGEYFDGECYPGTTMMELIEACNNSAAARDTNCGGFKVIMATTYAVTSATGAHSINTLGPMGRDLRTTIGDSFVLGGTSEEYWYSQFKWFTIERGLDANGNGWHDELVYNNGSLPLDILSGIIIDNKSANSDICESDGSDDSKTGEIYPIAVVTDGGGSTATASVSGLTMFFNGCHITDSSYNGTPVGTGVKIINQGSLEMFSHGNTQTSAASSYIENMAVAVDQINGKTRLKTSKDPFGSGKHNTIGVALSYGQSIGKWYVHLSSGMSQVPIWLRDVEHWKSGDIVMDSGWQIQGSTRSPVLNQSGDYDINKLRLVNRGDMSTVLGLEYYYGSGQDPYPVIRFYAGTVYNTRTHQWYKTLYDAVTPGSHDVIGGLTQIQDNDTLVFYGNTLETQQIVVNYNVTIRGAYEHEDLNGTEISRAAMGNYSAHLSGASTNWIQVASGKTVTFGGNATTDDNGNVGTLPATAGTPGTLTIDAGGAISFDIVNYGTTNLKNNITISNAAVAGIYQEGEEHLYEGALFSGNAVDHWLRSDGSPATNHYITLETRNPNGGNIVSNKLGTAAQQYNGRDVVVAGTNDNIGTTLDTSYLAKFTLTDKDDEYDYVYTVNGGPNVERVLELKQKAAIKVRIYKEDEDGSPLNGAGFTLYKVTGTTETPYTLGNETNPHTTSGSGTTEMSMREGNYKIKETTVPAGYDGGSDLTFTVSKDTTHGGDPYIDTNTYTDFTLVTGTADTYEVTVRNTKKTVPVTLKKINEKNAAISGVTFGLDSNTTTHTTGSDGTVSLGTFKWGSSHTLHETWSSPDYVALSGDITISVNQTNGALTATPASSSDTVTVTGNATSGYTITVTNHPEKVKVALFKVGDDTNGAGVAGSSFKLTSSIGGSITLSPSSTTGLFNTVELEGGTYTITETTPPPGYETAANGTLTVTVNPSKDISVSGTGYSKSGPDADGVYTITVTDVKKKVPVTLRKTNSNGVGLGGVTFGFDSQTTNITTGDGTGGTTLGEVSLGNLTYGTSHTLHETWSDSHYKPLNGDITFAVNSSTGGVTITSRTGDTVNVTGNVNAGFTIIITNQPTSLPVQIIKVNQSRQTLTGATLSLKHNGNEVLTSSEVTDIRNNGQVILPIGRLELNTVYTIDETAAPSGYKLLTSAISFQIVEDASAQYGYSLKDENGRAWDPASPLKYEIQQDSSTGTKKLVLSLTNNAGVELPQTGGSGTLLYTLGGIALIMASALMYGFRMRRRERRLN